MSTTYYQLKPPITSVRVEKADKYNKLHIWIAHQKAGTLLVSEHEVADLLLLFADYLKVALYTHFTKGELQIDPSDKGLPDSNLYNI